MEYGRSRIDPVNETGIIVAWLVKLIVVIGVFGLIAIEAVGVLIARYKASEGASSAASQAALGLRTEGVSGDPRVLAQTAAAQHGSELVSLHRNLETKMVFVTVERQAQTFFIQDVKFLEPLTQATATADAFYGTR